MRHFSAFRLMTPARAAHALVLGLVLGTMAAAAGCGTDEEAESRKRQAAERAQAEREKRAAAERKERDRVQKAKEAFETCTDELGDYLESLDEINSRLDIGLSYDEYTDQVGDLRVEYGKIDFDDLGDAGLTCLSDVGVPSENALNQYTKAAKRWGACFEDFDCDTDSIQPALQKRWSRASTYVEKAEEGLDKLEEEAEPRSPAATGSASAAGAPDEETVTAAVEGATGSGVVDKVAVESSGRVAVYLEYGEDAEAVRDDVCDAVMSSEPDARAAIHEYHDEDQDTSSIAATCGGLSTP
jgi:hypothetical protein